MIVDVVYPLGNGSKFNNLELRYSLRALEKNFLSLGRVFIATQYMPAWITGVIHLDVPDTHKRNKDANLIDKVIAACKAGISNTFLRSSDDEMLLLPSRVGDLKKYHAGPLATKDEAFWEGGWKERLRRTYNLLNANGLPTLHYDTHIPTICNRALFLEVAKRYDYRSGNGYCINTLYCNHEGIRNPPIGKNKVSFRSPVADVDEARRRLVGRRYLNCNDAGFTTTLQLALQEMFPTRSRFETDDFAGP
jgi:hypothetical protein